MDFLGTRGDMMGWRQIERSVSTAEMGDLIEFANPWSGLSLWAVYIGDGQVVHFGVGDENMTQKACRSFLQQMVPKSRGGAMLKKTRIRSEHIGVIKVPLGTRVRVNNSRHQLDPATPDTMRQRWETFLHQEFKYDLMNFNSEHFATFVRYGRAMCSQIPFQRKHEAHTETTQTLQMIMDQRMETET